MKKHKCNFIDCSRKGIAILKCKYYCDYHFRLQKSINKSKVFGKGFCKVPGCRNLLRYTNHSGVCKEHRK